MVLNAVYSLNVEIILFVVVVASSYFILIVLVLIVLVSHFVLSNFNCEINNCMKKKYVSINVDSVRNSTLI
jgi:hypothetical protein